MNIVKSQDKKINTPKSQAFLHTNNKKSEREINGDCRIHHVTKRIKDLGWHHQLDGHEFE